MYIFSKSIRGVFHEKHYLSAITAIMGGVDITAKSRLWKKYEHLLKIFYLLEKNIINPRTSKGGDQIDPPLGFSDLKFEAFEQSK